MSTACPEPGLLRAWVDGENGRSGRRQPIDALPLAESASVTPAPATVAGRALGEHLTGCHACQSTLDVLGRDADNAARALDTLAGPPPTPAETERALARLRGRLARESSPDRAPVIAATATAAHLIPTAAHLTSTAALSCMEHGERLAVLSGSGGGHEAGSAVPGPVDTPSQGHPITVTRSRPESGSGDQTSHPRRVPMSIAAALQRWRLALGGVAAALALTLLFVTPQGQAAAAGFLAQFRSQRLAIVTFDPNQARQTGMFRLERLGTVKSNQASRPAEVANAQEAASRAGFPILQPDPATLPPGASKTPKIRFSPASESRLTFDREKVRTYFDSINREDLSLPDKLHGSTLVVALPPVVTLEYATEDNKPAVMIGEAREVQVAVEGDASLDEVRSFLLSLPDMPPDLVRQLRSIEDWTSTLPIPVPVDKMTWQETTIAGAPAYILNDNTGLGSGAIWQRDGRILGVAGPMKAADLRRIAESLR